MVRGDAGLEAEFSWDILIRSSYMGNWIDVHVRLSLAPGALRQEPPSVIDWKCGKGGTSTMYSAAATVVVDVAASDVLHVEGIHHACYHYPNR